MVLLQKNMSVINDSTDTDRLNILKELIIDKKELKSYLNFQRSLRLS